MKSISAKIALIFLLIVCLTALYGGAALMIEPSGRLLEMSTGSLEHSPFPDYLIPGIFLFAVIGCGSLLASIELVRGRPYAPALVIFCGLILDAWIIIQVLILNEINGFHAFYFTTGVFLVVFGNKLRKGAR